MPDMRIDELTELGAAPAEDDLFVLSSGSTTYKAQQKNLRRALIGGVPATTADLVALIGGPTSTDTTTVIGASAYQMYPSQFVNTVTVTALRVNVTVAGTGTLRPAIYRLNPNFSVGALLAGNTTGFDVSTTGVKTLSSLSWTIPAGLVWIVLHSTVSVTLTTPRTNPVGWRAPRLTTDPTTIVRYYTRTSSSWPGSWSDPGPQYNDHSTSTTYGGRNPLTMEWSI